MFQLLIGVFFGIFVGFKYGVTKVEIAGYTREELVAMKDDCERLHPRTIHCVPIVKYKAVGVPTGGKGVPQLKSYDPSVDKDDKVFDEPIQYPIEKPDYAYTAENADPLLLKSWDQPVTLDLIPPAVEPDLNISKKKN